MKKTDSVMESSEEGIGALKISLLGLGVTAALQLAIVLLSGSVALLADTIHNFADAGTSIPLWIAFSLSKGGARRNSPMATAILAGSLASRSVSQHEVFIGGRDIAKARHLAEKLGHGAQSGSEREATAFGEVIVLATTHEAVFAKRSAMSATTPTSFSQGRLNRRLRPFMVSVCWL